MRFSCFCVVLLLLGAVRAQEPAQVIEPESNEQASVGVSEDSAALIPAHPLAGPQPVGDRPVRLMVARPNSFAYDALPKDLWLGAVVEYALRLKLGGLVEVVPDHRILSLLPETADYGHRVSRQEHTEAAVAVNASHLLYSEMEMLSGNQAVLHAALINIDDGGSGESMNIPLDTRDLDHSLAEAVGTVAAALNSTPDEAMDSPVENSVFGDNARQVTRIGEILVEAGAEGSDMAQKARQCEGLASERFTLATFVAARLYARAGRHGEAAGLMEALHAASGYDQLLLLGARSARLDGRPDDAMQMVSRFEDDQGTSNLSCLEKGRAQAAQGKITGAREQFALCAQSPSADPQAHVELARLALLAGERQEAQRHLTSASALGGRPEGELAAKVMRQFKSEDRITAALEAGVLSITADPGSADNWLLMAQCHESAGQLVQAAEAYLTVFNLNPVSYREHLDRAAGLFLNAGKGDAARTAYRKHLAQRNDPEATISLARIASEENNCERAVDLLAGLDQTHRKDERVVRIARECAGKLPPSSQHAAVELLPPDPTKRSRPQLSRRMVVGIPTGFLAAGALAGGIVMDRRLASTLEDYRESNSAAEVNRLHDDMDQTVKVRNALYAASGVAAVGFTVNIIIPGRRTRSTKEKLARTGGPGL